MEVFRNLPFDVIHEIMDYFDYAKYCKPEHKEAFSTTLSNINDFRSVFTTGIKPIIVKSCLGRGDLITIEDWGITTLRHYVEQVLEPYYQNITEANYMDRVSYDTDYESDDYDWTSDDREWSELDDVDFPGLPDTPK